MVGFAAPLGLALASGGTALVVDLAPDAVAYRGEHSVAQLLEDGPRAVDLTPERSGVAVLPSGGADVEAAAELVDHFVAGWPAVVLRMEAGAKSRWPMVPVVPLLPVERDVPSGRVVFQDLGWGVRPSEPGLIAPVPRRATWQALAAGRRPIPDRWVRSLREVWQWV